MTKLPVGWILMWCNGWVRLDGASGGYPVKVDHAREATIFHDTDVAVRYAQRVGANAEPKMLWVEV